MSITDTTKKIIQASLAAFDEANVYDDIISYVLQKHALELSFISDPDIRYNIMNQRAATALEELGVVDDLVDIMKGVGLLDLLSNLQDEKNKLQQKQVQLSEQLNALTKDLVDLQISAFGQMEFKVDSLQNNFSLPLKRPEDVVPDTSPEPPIAAIIKAWRSVQPNELTLGIRGSVGQVVLVRLSEGVWSLGVITQLLYREEPLSLIDLNQHVNNGGSKISSERYRSDAKSDGNIRYLVTVEYPSQRQFCDVVDQSKLALSLSSEALMQKYPVALYQDANGVSAYYSGIVGEPPNSYNNYRYLIFFDDGYAYYAQSDCIFRVFAQSKENWKLVNPEIQEFIKRYLAQFPQRPMVKLSVDQTIQAELNGNWLQATVVQVDYSLVLLRFPSGNVEWIYRGSRRLGPLSNKPYHLKLLI
ncbi:histone lysine n methyltransferase setb1 [Echinococcus multilocularis]|uniref:Histone lysine n methyltransferase setb1 n=1 Tax=Echinococcus multilocularis TaxID=6211 RepID=A0A068XTU2_ECHMU|nr:histone lysine n methyltransferase setb1 [Echinococcus multilocularis]